MTPHPLAREASKVYSIAFDGVDAQGRTCTTGSGYKYDPKITIDAPPPPSREVKALAVAITFIGPVGVMNAGSIEINAQFAKYFELEETGTAVVIDDSPFDMVNY